MLAKQGKAAAHDAESLLRSLQLILKPLADRERAQPMRDYMRGQFDFLGIPAPALRAAIRPALRAFLPNSSAELMEAAEALWRLPEREYQYCAVELMRTHGDLLTSRDVRQILAFVQKKSWWDTVDALAKVIGTLVRKDPEQGPPQMDRALQSRNLWVRRVAMIHQLGWRSDTDVARLLRYSEHLAPETDFFIRKAIGWALRDYSKCDPQTVRKFLAQRGSLLSPLTAREAGRLLNL